ncbi:MAG: EamA family transporter [Armatimonadetes bacterium]|nr:EamA family transporter [Armatimonadota bacterium]
MLPSIHGYLNVAAAAVLWGTLGVAVRSLLASGLSPLQAAAWRAGGAFAVLLLYCLLANRAALRVRRGDLPLLVAYGAVSVAGFFTVYFTAIGLTTVATAAVLLYTAPVWVVILARALYGEAMTPMKTAAVALTFAGCALVVGALGPGAVRLTPSGLMAGLGAGLTYALYSIFGKAALCRHSPLTTVVYTLGFGAILLVAASGGLPPVRTAALPAIAYLIAAPTCAAYLLYIAGLRRIEAGRASVVATLEPVVAALVGTLLLHEPMAAAQWAGAALVVGGVVLVQGEHILRKPAGR